MRQKVPKYVSPKMVAKLLKTLKVQKWSQSLTNFWKIGIATVFVKPKILPNNAISAAESLHILKVKKWCQNGSNPLFQKLAAVFGKSDVLVYFVN